MDRRHFLLASAAAALAPLRARARAPARIALLLPMTGEQAELGQMLHGTAMTALDAINGKVRPLIQAQVEDWRSDPTRFAALVRALGSGPAKPEGLFGPCPDTLRAELGGFLDEYGGVLWDPSGYEGGECSGGILHGGPTPHQSLKQLLPFMAREVGRRFLLVGGQGPRSRALNRAARWSIGRMDAAVLGEATTPEERLAALRSARRSRVDVIFCSLEGAELVSFLRAYRDLGLDPLEMPVASPTMTELETRAAGVGVAAGHVACQPYFAGLRTLGNDRFLAALRARLGPGFTPTAMAEALWGQLHLFARGLAALDDVDELHPLLLREGAKSAEVLLPQGRVRMEPDTLHLSLWPKIAVAEPDGAFKVIAKSDTPIKALPFWMAASCPARELDEPV